MHSINFCSFENRLRKKNRLLQFLISLLVLIQVMIIAHLIMRLSTFSNAPPDKNETAEHLKLNREQALFQKKAQQTTHTLNNINTQFLQNLNRVHIFKTLLSFKSPSLNIDSVNLDQHILTLSGSCAKDDNLKQLRDNLAEKLGITLTLIHYEVIKGAVQFKLTGAYAK
jgi:hypothetical protein